LAVPAIARRVRMGHDLFPLTPALSPRRGSPVARDVGKLTTADLSRDGIGFTLPPRERARVRGKGTLARHTV